MKCTPNLEIAAISFEINSSTAIESQMEIFVGAIKRK
jgi:hypothetical protein